MEYQRVSVIVPIYNVEKYLGDCLDSIITQTYADIEIILVDDGSTDHSLEICRFYQKKDKRIKVIHQENCGVAIARKRALEAAESEYVCFVDADDMVDAKLVEILVGYAEEAELVTSGCEREDRGGALIVRKDGFLPGVYNSPEQMRYVYDNMILFEDSMSDGLLPYIFGKLFKRTLALDVMNSMGHPLKIDEDRAFVLCYTEKCRSICVTNHILYYYRFRAESAMHTMHEDYLENLNEYYLMLKEFFEKNIYTDRIKFKLQKFVSNRLLRATTYMGFDWKLENLIYFHPFSNLITGKKIVIYGAGAVGKNYYREILQEIKENNIYWTDKNWEQISRNIPCVQPLDKIFKFDFDVVILAVQREYHANRMREQLADMGIENQKIWWKPPIILNEL